MRELLQQTSVKLTLTAVISAIAGAVLSQWLWSDNRVRAVPLDEWRPSRQEFAAEVDLPSTDERQGTRLRADTPGTASRAASAISAEPNFSDLLTAAPAFGSVVATWPDQSPNSPAATGEPNRPKARPGRTAARTAASSAQAAPSPTALPPPPETPSAGTREEPSLLQKSQDAIVAAPGRAWSASRDAVSSAASFGSAVWDRIAR